MKKKLAVLFVFICSLFSFNSCDLTMSGTYTFSHYVEFAVEKEDTKKALENYFKSILDFQETFTYTGERSAAIAYGITKLEETAKKFNKDQIIGLLGEKDWVIYSMFITGPKTEAAIGGITWSQAKEGDEESGETISYAY